MKPGLITIVVPVFNPDVTTLSRALGSIAAQTLDKPSMRIIIVDDGSSEPKASKLLETLAGEGSFEDVPLEVVRHPDNLWLARARVSGAIRAETPFLVFLDSDDYISRSYLKKAILLLSSNPRAGWVYPNTYCFGEYTETRPAETFRPFQVFLRNRNPYACVYRREVWLEASQRERKVLDDVRFFEDWDTTIRLMAKGHFGVPLADSTFFYYKSSSGLNSRPTKLYLLSIYTTWRANLFRIPLIMRSVLRHHRARRRNTGYPARYNPIRLSDKVQRFLLRQALETPDFNSVLDTRTLLTGLFNPKRFTSQFLDPDKAITLAEIRCGFVRKPKLPPVVDVSITGSPRPETVLFGHTWWTVGGSENVLLEWFDAAVKVGMLKILDVAQLSTEENPDVKRQFSEWATEQYCLARIGDTPLDRLLFCWNLICRERPKLIVISANACLYALAPSIKRQFPEITIVDILHNEWQNGIDWFNVAQEYQDSLDCRIVISEYWGDKLVDKYAEDPEKVFVCPNFVDTSRFIPPSDPLESRRALGFDDDKKIISFVGRLHEQKNPQVFCELAARFAGDPRYHFVIVGNGPLEDALKDQYGRLRNLEFRGLSLMVERFLAASDLLVFCSRFEGSPLGSLEAAAMNVPVIAPDITGFREQVEQGGIGLLYKPTHYASEDGRTIAHMIRERYDELLQTGRNSRQFILEHHSRKALKNRQTERFREFLGTYASSLSTVPTGPRKKRLYLHIGWTKTGSSSIQHFLYNNRLLLQEMGYHYPTSQEWGLAHHLLAYYFTYIPKYVPSTLWARFPDRETFKDSMGRHIDSLAKTPFRNTIISSEAFRRADPSLLAERLTEFEVVVIVYLRRQDEWLEATINQNKKMATGSTFELDSREKWHRICRRILDYHSILEKWSQVFGPDNFRVVPFETAEFSEGLERHFLGLVGVDWSDKFEIQEKKNRRLSRDCLAFIQEHWGGDRAADPEFHGIVQALETYSDIYPDPPEYASVLPPATRVEVLNYCRESNEKTARELLGRPDGALFRSREPALSDPWQPYPGLSPGSRREIREYLMERGFDIAENRKAYHRRGSA